jgi:uncharacterized membrane protein YfcA
MHYVLLFGTGIVVGVMNSIAGGGMLIGFPLLLATGLPPLVANATTNIVVMPGQIGAIIGYRKYLKKVPFSYLLLAVPCAIGAAIGASLLKRTPSARFNEMIPGLLFLAVILFAVQPLLHFHLRRHLRGQAKSSLPLVLIGLTLLPLSIYGGYFGVGFGFVILAFLGFTKMHDIHQINALKNIATLCIALASILVLLHTGLIDWKHGSAMAAGCLLGGYYGARFAQRFSSHAIRIVVIIIGFSAVTYLALRTY